MMSNQDWIDRMTKPYWTHIVLVRPNTGSEISVPYAAKLDSSPEELEKLWAFIEKNYPGWEFESRAVICAV